MEFDHGDAGFGKCVRIRRTVGWLGEILRNDGFRAAVIVANVNVLCVEQFPASRMQRETPQLDVRRDVAIQACGSRQKRDWVSPPRLPTPTTSRYGTSGMLGLGRSLLDIVVGDVHFRLQQICDIRVGSTCEAPNTWERHR